MNQIVFAHMRHFYECIQCNILSVMGINISADRRGKMRGILFDRNKCGGARGIGYKELFPYFSGEQTLDEALEKLKQNTRRFAKRQFTRTKNSSSHTGSLPG